MTSYHFLKALACPLKLPSWSLYDITAALYQDTFLPHHVNWLL